MDSSFRERVLLEDLVLNNQRALNTVGTNTPLFVASLVGVDPSVDPKWLEYGYLPEVDAFEGGWAEKDGVHVRVDTCPGKELTSRAGAALARPGKHIQRKSARDAGQDVYVY